MSNAIDNKITTFEYKHGVRAIASKAPALYYFFDEDKKGVGIVTFHNGKPLYTVMSKKQAQAVIQEFSDVCEMIFG